MLSCAVESLAHRPHEQRVDGAGRIANPAGQAEEKGKSQAGLDERRHEPEPRMPDWKPIHPLMGSAARVVPAEHSLRRILDWLVHDSCAGRYPGVMG